MEGFIDKLYELWKSLFGREEEERSAGTDTGQGRSRQASTSHGDADFREAWEELDEFMRTGSNRSRQAGASGGRSSRPHPVDESLRQDYANLEVPFGADIEDVRRSYKHLMLKYHPDKHAGNPEKQKIALEITKKINESFERIRSRQEGVG